MGPAEPGRVVATTGDGVDDAALRARTVVATDGRRRSSDRKSVV